MEYRRSEGLDEDYLGIGLTSRKNLCLHPVVSKQRKGKVVDSMCRNMTASWVRAKAGKGKNTKQDETPDKQIELCDFYEVCFAFGYITWSKVSKKKNHFSNWMQPIHPIQSLMAYIPWLISKIIARKCDSVLIIWFDAWYVGMASYEIIAHVLFIDTICQCRHLFLPLYA